MVTACACCERIRLRPLVDAARAIRSCDWKRPPQFTHGICEICLEDVERRSSTATAARQSIEMTLPTDMSVIDNAGELRYELHLGGVLVAEIRYRLEPGARVLVDVDVEPRLEGHGLGRRLVEAVLDDLRARGLAVVPHAMFVADFIKRHPEYSDLVAADPEVSD